MSQSASLFDAFERLEGKSTKVECRDTVVKAPFGYPGGKSRSVPHLMKHLPYTGRYVEVFGGSGVTLLNRHAEKFEVYNDRFGGVVDFYKCVKDPVLVDSLIEYLDYTVKSREMFLDYQGLMVTSKDPVERAACWYYMIQHSFSTLGRNFGRDLKRTDNKINSHFPLFKQTHNRLRNVLIENLDWAICLKDFDDHDTVFYCDPPYMNTTVSGNLYEHAMTQKDHIDLCEMIHHTKGYVALSGYENEIYMTYPWDDIQMWDVHISMTSLAFTDTNGHENLQDRITRGSRTERLYIKYARG